MFTFLIFLNGAREPDKPYMINHVVYMALDQLKFAIKLAEKSNRSFSNYLFISSVLFKMWQLNVQNV